MNKKSMREGKKNNNKKRKNHDFCSRDIESYLSCNCSILGLADTVAFFANEALFIQIYVFFRACSLHDEVGDPPFFLHF